jgi:hypothetical protein
MRKAVIFNRVKIILVTVVSLCGSTIAVEATSGIGRSAADANAYRSDSVIRGRQDTHVRQAQGGDQGKDEEPFGASQGDDGAAANNGKPRPNRQCSWRMTLQRQRRRSLLAIRRR